MIFHSKSNHPPLPETERMLVIEPGRTEKNYWADLWRYRELFLILAWRDISVRCKQTIIGIAWAVIRPFLMMVVFTLIFGRLAGLPGDGDAPYALMVFAAMLPWTLFSTSLGEASNSLIGNQSLIGKVYFPRLIIPAATVVAAFVDFLISLTILPATCPPREGTARNITANTTGVKWSHRCLPTTAAPTLFV